MVGCAVIVTVAAGTGTVGVVVGGVVVPPVVEPVEPLPAGIDPPVPEPPELGVSVPVVPPPPQAANMAEVTAAKRN